MPVNQSLTTTVAAGTPYYRITNPSFHTTNSSLHSKVVNGQGAVNSYKGTRYNAGGVLTVYLTENVDACFAERMFYFHRETLNLLDQFHKTNIPPLFIKRLVLWEIEFANDVNDVFDMSNPSAPSFYQVFPTLMLNPSQDYDYLKDRRSFIASQGYQGLRAPSSRDKGGGNIIALFKDQSSNVPRITPYSIEFRLITNHKLPFNNHVTDILDFTSGQARITAGSSPKVGSFGSSWQSVDFNH